jgi:hypothetical protein
MMAEIIGRPEDDGLGGARGKESVGVFFVVEGVHELVYVCVDVWSRSLSGERRGRKKE